MTELVSDPPKYQLEDGSIQVWRGMPKLPDVVQVILENREKSYVDSQRREREKQNDELKALEQQRNEHPEEFFGLKDLVKKAKEMEIGKAAKIVVMPQEKENISPILLGHDGGKRESELKAQAERLMRELNDSSE